MQYWSILDQFWNFWYISHFTTFYSRSAVLHASLIPFFPWKHWPHFQSSGSFTVHWHLRHLWPAWSVRSQKPHQPLLCAGLPSHGGPGEERVLSHIGQSAAQVQWRRWRPHVLSCLPYGLLGRPCSVVSVAKSDDGTLVSVHMVPPAVHAVLALHTDQHAGADEQAGWAGQEGVVAATRCSITWLLRQYQGDDQTRLCWRIVKTSGLRLTCQQMWEIKMSKQTMFNF